MNIRPIIHKVVYRWGMVTDPTNWQGLKTTVLERAELSDEVVDAIFDNDLLAAGGVYGVPDAGEPVEISSLQITHEHGVTEVTVYNLGIMLFHTDDEVYRRVLRVCSVIGKQTERQLLENSHVDRGVPKTLAEPVKQARPRSVQESQQAVYQLKVVLLETDPQIWRRFVVPSSVTLHRLHLILQDVVGWTNSHLYRFQVGTKEYAEPDPDNEFNELDFKNSRRTQLGRLVTKKGSTFLYEYDFGDSWLHELVVEDILEHKPGIRYPACLAGERACPPEDCGGIYGYAELLEVMNDPEHEEYPDTMTWLGGRFDPEAFDLKAVNNKLRSMRV
jgi:hypothetical protein